MNICPPVIVYIIFSLTQLLLDLKNNLINVAFFKIIIIGLVSFLLIYLCNNGQIVIAWLIVFIPFIFMSIIIGILLYSFGLNPTTGYLNLPPNVKTDNSGNIIIYDPSYNPVEDRVHYEYPNIIVPLGETSVENFNLPLPFNKKTPELPMETNSITGEIRSILPGFSKL